MIRTRFWVQGWQHVLGPTESFEIVTAVRQGAWARVPGIWGVVSYLLSHLWDTTLNTHSLKEGKFYFGPLFLEVSVYNHLILKAGQHGTKVRELFMAWQRGSREQLGRRNGDITFKATSSWTHMLPASYLAKYSSFVPLPNPLRIIISQDQITAPSPIYVHMRLWENIQR